MFYSLQIDMKLFSNFDTKLSQDLLKEAKLNYGEEKVIYIRRDVIYLIIKRLPPLFLFVIMIVPSIYIYSKLSILQSNISNFVISSIIFIISIITLYLLYYNIGRYIDYKMDFVIITPKNITSFDQTGIFHRTSISLDIEKIKTINIDANGRLSSVFSFGNIIFLSEWDTEHGDITLKYITHPEQLKKQIEEIIE